jgi:HAMP domain-containing protein/CHASE3 domain sensor protein
MTVRKRLEIGIGIPLIIFLVFSVIFYLQVRYIGRYIKQVAEVEAPKCRAALSMKSELIGMGFALVGYLNNPDKVEAEWIESYKKDFRKNQVVYCQLTEDRQDELSAATIDKNIAFLWKIAEELVNLQDHQRQRLSMFAEKVEEADKISEDGLKNFSESSDKHTFNGLRPFMEIRIWADDIEEDIHCYLKDHKKNCRDKIYQNQEDFGRLLKGYKGADGVSSKDQWLGQICSIQEEIAGLVDDIITLEDRKESRLNDFLGKKEGLSAILDAEIEKAHRNFEEVSQKSYMAVTISTAVVLLLVFAGLISAFVSQAFMNYMVIQPITELQDAAAKISRGQYDTRIEVESGDELGQIAHSISSMAEELKGTSVPSDLSSEGTAEREKAGISS